MQPIAIITSIHNRELDTVIIWHDGQRSIAYGYHHGHVKRTTPLDADTLDGQMNELRAIFRITDGNVILLQDASNWTPAASSQPVVTHLTPRRSLATRRRWE